MLPSVSSRVSLPVCPVPAPPPVLGGCSWSWPPAFARWWLLLWYPQSWPWVWRCPRPKHGLLKQSCVKGINCCGQRGVLLAVPLRSALRCRWLQSRIRGLRRIYLFFILQRHNQRKVLRCKFAVTLWRISFARLWGALVSHALLRSQKSRWDYSRLSWENQSVSSTSYVGLRIFVEASIVQSLNALCMIKFKIIESQRNQLLVMRSYHLWQKNPNHHSF